MTRIGCTRDFFNPPSRAHVEIALAAREAHGLVRVDPAVSPVALGRNRAGPRLAERLDVIRVPVEEASAGSA